MDIITEAVREESEASGLDSNEQTQPEFISETMRMQAKASLPAVAQSLGITLYDWQEMLAKHIIDGDNTGVLVGTGGGKTLGFAVPIIALAQQIDEGKMPLAIIVSPLKTLQKDMVDCLNKLNTNKKACFIHGSLPPNETKTLHGLIAEDKNLLFILATPEALQTDHWKTTLFRDICSCVVCRGQRSCAWGLCKKWSNFRCALY
jgi:ATP-dependent helicase YprA (DUF1998 family)